MQNILRKKFPAAKSTIILNDSVTDALLPNNPLFPTKKLAEEKFLVCVAGDNTVLPY